MKKLTLFFYVVMALSQQLDAQVKGAFTDVFIKKALFRDIPDRVVNYIDSTSFFFLSINTNMVRNFDANNYITTGKSIVEINGLADEPEVLTINFRSTLAGNIQTILPEIENEGYEEFLAREVIEYSNNLPTKINIDTLDNSSQWRSKYKYEFTYANGQISSMKYYKVNRSGFYLYNESYLTYKAGRLDYYTNSVYEPGYPKETYTGRYYYTGSKLDSLLDVNGAGGVANKFVPTYGSSGSIISIEHFADVFGLTSIGKSYFYGQNISAVKEKKSMDNLIVNNPVKDYLFIENPEMFNLEILDFKGKVLVEGKSNERVDLTALPQGIYLLSINGSYGRTVRKILKN